MKKLKKIGQLSLISATLIGFVHFPAQADTANLQNSDPDAVISGDNNQVTQIINQTIINHPGRGSLNRSDNMKKDKTQNSEDNRGNHYGVERNADRGNRNGLNK
jgi:hypothetical protein